VGRVELGGGEPIEAAVLGRSHPHGAWLEWCWITRRRGAGWL